MAGAVFSDLRKKSYGIFAGRRATFCVFGTFWMVFFFDLFVALLPFFGGGGGGGMIMSFRSRPLFGLC